MIKDVEVPLNAKVPEVKRRKSQEEQDYELLGIDLDKVKRFWSVYILYSGCQINNKLVVVGAGTIKIIYCPAIIFSLSSQEKGLSLMTSFQKYDVEDGDMIIPLQTFKSYPGTDRFQIDRDSFVIYFKKI